MYWFMSIDAVLRIAIAMVVIFVVVPALAGQRRRGETALEQFFWNFGVGITLITLAGQLFSLANLFSLITLALMAALLILLGRAAGRKVTPLAMVNRPVERSFVALLNLFDRRVNVRRRIRRQYRRSMASLREKTAAPEVRWRIAAWTTLAVIAAGLRFYRAFASANLGFSDTYVHLYLVKLLQDGRQVDPEWGPYPRGMHFLLLAIHHLTNIDPILLMNFFGAFAGILMTLAVADAARRISRSLVAGLISGFLFATLVGGPGQYFILGGAVGSDNPAAAARSLSLSYRELATGGEFDLALTAFHRQTSTLSQELAIALLFPAAMFLLDYFRRRDRWHLFGFVGCTAAIAAVHSGVVVPLVVMSAVMTAALGFCGALAWRPFRQAVAAGFFAIVIGSSWALAFIAYPYTGRGGLRVSVSTTAHYYFPFLRSFAPAQQAQDVGAGMRVFVGLTPFLITCVLLAVALSIAAWRHRDDKRANLLWISGVFLTFLLIHFASTIGFPQIVETTRNSQWLLMSIAALLGVAMIEMGSLAGTGSRPRMATAAIALLLAGWTSRVPLLSNPLVRDRLVDYSGYGGSALAVLRIGRTLQPYTWTLVSYGQEFPMVLGRGFHLPASDFLGRYDPAERVVPIPTRHLFIIVEKTPHPFQINAWSTRFNRAELQQRLQTWVHLYQSSHANVRVFLEDEHVRVYQIERTEIEMRNERQARR